MEKMLIMHFEYIYGGYSYYVVNGTEKLSRCSSSIQKVLPDSVKKLLTPLTKGATCIIIVSLFLISHTRKISTSIHVRTTLICQL